MPREITKTWTVYKLDELGEQAQQKAIQQICEKLSGPWWDESDNDDIRNTIVWKFAHVLGTPGCEEFGEADFPGISGVRLEGWDLDRGQSVDFSGTLTRDNAPNLPWVDSLDVVTLSPTRWYGTTIDVQPVYNYDAEDAVEATQQQLDAMKEAVRDAMHEAWKAGYAEMEYKSSEEYAKDMIEANEYEFEADGDFFGGNG